MIPARPYFYRLSPPTGHHELAWLEFRALTGDRADETAPSGEPTGVERLAWARVGVDVQRAAYITECCRLLAEAEDLEGLLRAAEKLHLRRERFRIRVRKSGRLDAPATQEIERRVADTITGRPDLSRPAVELVALGRPEGWLLGELVSRSERGWLGHEQRPRQYSSALPPRIARAMVNLVAVPGDTIIDLCCGVGTVLGEAASLGIQAVGIDHNPTVVEHARTNLCHHGWSAPVAAADGRDVRGRFDGAVLDLPYGVSSPRVDRVCHALVERALQVARLVAVVTTEDMRELMEGFGAEMIGVAALTKGNLTRRVHWAHGMLSET